MGAAEPLEELLPISRVCAMTGMGKTWIYEQIKLGTFPASILVSGRARWVLSEIQTWIKDQVRLART